MGGNSKGSGKGGGRGGKTKNSKGGGRGRGNETPKGCMATLPDGRPVCFRYNSTGCQAPNCRFVHACGKCGAMGHPMGECSK